MIKRIAGGFEINIGRWSIVFILTRVIGLVYMSHVGSLKNVVWTLPLWPRQGRTP